MIDLCSLTFDLYPYADLTLSDEQLKNYALAEMEKLLHREGRSLRSFNNMPVVDEITQSDGVNRFIQEELR